MKIIKWKIGDDPAEIDTNIAIGIGNFDGIQFAELAEKIIM